MKNCRKVERCRACGSSDLEMAMHVGCTELANSFLAKEELNLRRDTYPLDVLLCAQCRLAQLSHVVDPDVLYRNYNYVTSTSKLIDGHLEIQAANALRGTRKNARVLEIASNTGVALQKYKQRGCEVLGVDPAQNIAEVAKVNGIETIAEYFSFGLAQRIGKFDVVVARHVLAHIDDWHGFAEAVSLVCGPQTLVVIEVPYVVDTVLGSQFDTIYHEHLSYVSVGPVRRVFSHHGFKLVDVIRHTQIHGGSIELHFCLSGHETGKSVEAMEEQTVGNLEAWDKFSERISTICGDLVRFISSVKGNGKTIVGYGASARGNTLLNICGIRNLDYIIDNTPFKIGKYAPQSEIPIVGPGALIERKPDYAIVTAWTYFDEIVSREADYTRSGGAFVKPIPALELCQYL